DRLGPDGRGDEADRLASGDGGGTEVAPDPVAGGSQPGDERGLGRDGCEAERADAWAAGDAGVGPGADGLGQGMGAGAAGRVAAGDEAAGRGDHETDPARG